MDEIESELKLEEFKEELDSKIVGEENPFLTEDLIRYLFIKDIGFPNFKIEIPYRKICKKRTNLLGLTFRCNKSRIDAIYANQKNKKVAIEFKFHRATNRSQSCNSTDLGSVINDWNRLSFLGDEFQKNLFVYVYDNGMKDYLSKKAKKNMDCLWMFKPDSEGREGIVDKHFNSLKTKSSSGGEIVKMAFSSFSKGDFSNLNYKVKIILHSSLSNEWGLLIGEIKK
jgi:hypothetical protein